jgi:hypothetical protein
MTRKSAPRGRTPHAWPTPDEIDEAPELALLALLDTHLELLLRALVAAHPALIDRNRPSWRRDTSPAYRAAETLAARSARLLRAVAVYRRAIARRPQPPGPADVDF